MTTVVSIVNPPPPGTSLAPREVDAAAGTDVVATDSGVDAGVPADSSASTTVVATGAASVTAGGIAADSASIVVSKAASTAAVWVFVACFSAPDATGPATTIAAASCPAAV